jgi:hypothetical protein
MTALFNLINSITYIKASMAEGATATKAKE